MRDLIINIQGFAFFLAFVAIICFACKAVIKNGKIGAKIVCLNAGIAIAIYIISFRADYKSIDVFAWSIAQVFLCLISGSIIQAIYLIKKKPEIWTKIAKGFFLSIAFILLVSIPSCSVLMDRQGGIFYKTNIG